MCELAASYGFDVVLADDALRLIADGVFPPPPHPDSLDEAIGRAIARITPPWQNLADDGVTQLVITAACLTTDELPRLMRREPADDLTDLDSATLPPRPRPPASTARQNDDLDPTAPNPSDEEDAFIRCRACGGLVLIENAVCVHCSAPLDRSVHRHGGHVAPPNIGRLTEAICEADVATATVMDLLPGVDADGRPSLTPEEFLAQYPAWVSTLDEAITALERVSQFPAPTNTYAAWKNVSPEEKRAREDLTFVLAKFSKIKTMLHRLKAALNGRAPS